ncbi:heme-binding protein [Novosphingobium mangrovi (ex Huang et al. 2023)]|uniref:Heme-binding protein n=1 Tax=Novosphingobium mangrovi (ex Huang et al. 2023) TaxID=2976432 RepID=A0ABT2I9M9_9SPHN|nr:heme-binding protein [Novosphingobium mangrovi (ex Huang et al. 2023)]MCT2401536.1 heme-binding protein [Novosphingobium mangrovi (ex Huang et al. 2023)]
MRSGRVSSALAAVLLLTSCGGGDSQSGGGTPTPSPTPTPTTSPTGVPGTALEDYVAPSQEALTSAEVGKILAQAAAQAQQSGNPATIAVVDRVGNVLAVLAMTGAPATAKIPDAGNGQNIDLQGLVVPAAAAAIAKAVTGAYLSSGGNAFSSRTASMIVQEHFPPAPSTVGLESGPLFGVQFSQLPCSDFSARFQASGASALIGPKRSPLGLAADPGGFPLYKNGVLVGGIGVLADGAYSLDPNVLDTDTDVDERIALAGTVGFEAPQNIRADRIYVDGTQLRYSDTVYGNLFDVGGATYGQTVPALGALAAVKGYYENPVLLAGTAYGTETSGIREATAAEFADRDAFVLTDGSGNNRFPIRAATDAGDVAQPITVDEARALLEEAFKVMTRARAQIRQPLDSRAQVSISLVDTHGQVLGIVRSPDAPIFGTDVSLQKARTATFFSGANAGSELLADPSTDVQGFVSKVRTFLGDQSALTGTFAFADRSGGNLSRPYFPDGEVGNPNGPLSRPIAQWSPFSTGLQSALVLGNLAQHLQYVTGQSATDTPHRCTALPDVVAGQNRLQNGIQIFPGSVPVYRGTTLIGGMGVSGDGIDQDDMISFLGTNNAGVRLGTLGNAPVDMRADRIVVNVNGAQVRLRFVNCPFAPFLDSSEQNVCEGL